MKALVMDETPNSIIACESQMIAVAVLASSACYGVGDAGVEDARFAGEDIDEVDVILHFLMVWDGRNGVECAGHCAM